MTVHSKTENRTLMYQARESLKGFWILAVITFLVYILVLTIPQFIPKIGGLVSLLISGPMWLGLCIFALAISRKQDPRCEQLFLGFKRFGVSLGAYLLQAIFIILWAILLIIPGIIAALSYSMTFFIIADDDSTGPLEAIRKSKKIMYGNKWKFFCLNLRFIGWGLLCLLTLGIGFLWLSPYIFVSFAKFYDDIIKEHEAGDEKEFEFTSDLDQSMNQA
jgi:uncharacterized membrane protein